MSDGAKPLGPNDYFNRLASRVTAALSVPTAAGPLYELDTRLRPEGAKGMLTVSLDAFERYQREEAWTWEHMALCRARPVFGSPRGARAGRRDDRRDPRDAARFCHGRGGCGEDAGGDGPPQAAHGPLDVKLGPGGLVDLEFAVHVFQLTHPRWPRHPARRRARRSRRPTLVPANIVEALKLLSRMLVMMRLVAPGDIKPTAETWQLVAEACGAASWDELLAEHDAARHSISDLWTSIKKEA